MDSKPVLAMWPLEVRDQLASDRIWIWELLAKRHQVNCLKERMKVKREQAEPWKGSTERESKGTVGGAGKPAKGIVSLS